MRGCLKKEPSLNVGRGSGLEGGRKGEGEDRNGELNVEVRKRAKEGRETLPQLKSEWSLCSRTS